MVLRESFVPHQLPADAGCFDATTFPGVPFMFEYFIANPPETGWPRGLRRLISAGARLPVETVRGFFDRFGVKIHSFYGASESGGISYDDSDEVDHDDRRLAAAWRHHHYPPRRATHLRERAASTCEARAWRVATSARRPKSSAEGS